MFLSGLVALESAGWFDERVGGGHEIAGAQVRRVPPAPSSGRQAGFQAFEWLGADSFAASLCKSSRAGKLTARSPQARVLSQESSARNPAAKKPHSGVLSQESSTRSPQPGFLSQ